MKSMNILVAAATLLLLSFSNPALVHSSTENGQADAKTLLSHAQRSLGQVVKVAQTDPQLNTDKADSKPFWDSMKQANEALSKAETGLALKDDTFFSNVAVAHGQVVQADVALTMNGAGTAVRSQLDQLTRVVARLDESYSKEAASLKSNKKLTSQERKQLEKLQRQQKELLAKLDQVEKNAAKNNKEMQEGIAKIKKESEKIRKARKNRAGFVSGFIAARSMSYWMWGWHWWWGPWGAWCPGWIDIVIIDWGDWLDAVPYDWDLVDAYVDVSDLGLDSLDLSDAELAAADDYLIDSDFSLDEGELRELTSDLDYGWDDVNTDTGYEIESQMYDNFDSAPYDPGFDANTFDDHGMDDFGGDFGGGMDFGGDDW